MDPDSRPAAARQLHMLWPANRRLDPTALRVPRGYLLREGRTDVVGAFRELMARVDLGTWDDDHLARVRETLVDRGWHVVIHQPSGKLVATGMAQRNPIDGLYPDGYEVGWIAADPRHSGRGLGRLVTAAALQRLLDTARMCIYLRTDDFRLAAVKTYLTLGFVPHLYMPDMHRRWAAVCNQLSWPFTPQA
jgi:mycothiol synthase